MANISSATTARIALVDRHLLGAAEILDLDMHSHSPSRRSINSEDSDGGLVVLLSHASRTKSFPVPQSRHFQVVGFFFHTNDFFVRALLPLQLQRLGDRSLSLCLQSF